MNQLKLEFDLEKAFLPKELDRLLVSFIKATLQNSLPELYDKLYKQEIPVIKKYSFNYYLPDAVFEDGYIRLGEPSFTMYFSDVDFAELFCFFNGFTSMKNKRHPLKDNGMMLRSVTVQREKEIKESEIVIKMLSSLIVRDHDKQCNKDHYYTFNQTEFSEALKNNVKYFLENAGIQSSLDGFSIMPIKGKKVVVPVFGRNTDANLGIYKLTGTPGLLNILYLAGIGSRRSEGHGKFQVLL